MHFFLCSFDLGTRQLPAVKKTRQEGIGVWKAGLVSDSWAVSRAPPAACHGPCHLPSPHGCLHLRVRPAPFTSGWEGE